MLYSGPLPRTEMHGRVPDGTIVQLNEFDVHSKPALFREIPVSACAKLRGIAETAEDLCAAQIHLKNLLYDHRRGLQLVSLIRDWCDAARVGAREVVQPAAVIFRFERQSAIFDASIEAHHLVVDRFDGDAGPKRFGVKMMLPSVSRI